MTAAKPAHPLSYFAEVLSQMTGTLKDFDMRETAALLEQARADIEQELARDPEKTISGGAKKSVREGRQH